MPSSLRVRALLIGLCAFALAGSARAQTLPAFRLRYQRSRGAASCPDEQALRLVVATRLGHDPFRDDAANLVVVRLARDRRSLFADVERWNAAGHLDGARRIVVAGDDCGELVSAVSLMVSIIIDPLSQPAPLPSGVQRPVEQPVAPATVTPAPVAPTTAPSVAAAPQPRAVAQVREAAPPRQAPPERVRLHLGVGVGATALAAPSITATVMPQAALRVRAVSIGLEGRFDLPASGTVDGRGSFQTHLMLATAALCLHHSVFMGCALGSGGALRLAAPFIDGGAQLVGYLAAGARVGLEFNLTRDLLLRVHGDFLGTVTPTTFFLDGAPIWKTPPVSFLLGVALVGEIR